MDHTISLFNDFVNFLFDLCFPIKFVRLRSNDPPWMTPFVKFMFDKMDYTFFRNRGQYLKVREEYLRQVAFAKSKLSKSLFGSACSSKQKWKAINKLSKRSRPKSNISDSLADDLNVEFSNSFIPSDMQETDFLSLHSSFSSSCIEVSELDVFNELKSIRSSSSGHDQIKGWIFKRYAHEFAYPLTFIFNRCFQACYFPQVWKLANINPIPKGRSSHRPISLLPCASKILERLFVKHFLVPSLQTSFNRFQFGFLPTGFGGSSNAVTFFRLHVLRHLSATAGHVRCLQIDVAKAFDRASHSVILSTLQEYVANSPWILSFVHSFLTNRWQRVIASSGHCSSWIPITSGVPQGSVLGPILFAIMINKFPSLSKNSSMIAYADDLAILHDVSPSTPDGLQADLDIILQWLFSLKLSVNIDKFKSITFCRNPCSPPPPLTADGKPIPEVSEIKFLGVLFQSDAKTDRHLTSVLKKASRNLFFIKLLWLNGAPSNIIWEAYLSLVFSCFSYCWPAYCDIPSSFFRQFCSIEKRASKWSGTSFSVDNLRSRLDRICLRLVRKIVSLNDVHPLAEFFVFRPPIQGLRRTRSLQLPAKTKAFYRKSFLRFASFS